MSGRRFLSASEALGLDSAPETEQRPARPAPTIKGSLIATPLFRYGGRIIDALKAKSGHTVEIGALILELQTAMGDGFNITDLLAAIEALKGEGAVRSDGRIVALAPGALQAGL